MYPLCEYCNYQVRVRAVCHLSNPVLPSIGVTFSPRYLGNEEFWGMEGGWQGFIVFACARTTAAVLREF